ncbi:hypothetical protein ACFVH7_29620 [Kitasatospora indigofera]|uniref:hypothetical protein n=1 Tax=Kitasatospora indigofera TaxID=67307 RepID=UPI00363CBBAE
MAVADAAARESIDALSRSAPAGTLIPRDAEIGLAEAFGVHAIFAYRPDAAECSRRGLAGTPPLTRPDLLELLMGLPVGESVPVDSLSQSEQRALRSAPKGVLTRKNKTATRHAVQPLQIDLALVPGRGWETAMEKAESFTPFCARAILVDRPLRRRQDAMMQADFYGIGLLTITGDELDVLVAPRPFVRRRHTVAGWRFLENMYGQLAAAR